MNMKIIAHMHKEAEKLDIWTLVLIIFLLNFMMQVKSLPTLTFMLAVTLFVAILEFRIATIGRSYFDDEMEDSPAAIMDAQLRHIGMMLARRTTHV